MLKAVVEMTFIHISQTDNYYYILRRIIIIIIYFNLIIITIQTARISIVYRLY